MALIVATYVVGAASSAWRMLRSGLVGVLVSTGAPGYLLVGYWLITFTVGPLACVQLWRRHRVGRAGSIIVVGCSLAVDIALYFLADAGSWLAQLPAAIVQVGILLLLVYALRDRTPGITKETAL